MDIFKAMDERRSVRKYLPDPVEEADFKKIMEAGRIAPSWTNNQVWEIVVVKDQKMKEALCETLSEKNPARRAVIEAPVVLAACGRTKESGYKKGEVTTKLGEWLMFDVALFLHNVSLAAYALGYGTVHIGLFDHDKATKLLKIPAGVQIVELMPLGRPVLPLKSAPKRREAAEFLHWEKY